MNASETAIDAASYLNDSAQYTECAGCHEFYPKSDMDEIDEWFTLCPWCSDTYHDAEMSLRPCPECRNLKEIDEFVGDVCCDCRDKNMLA